MATVIDHMESTVEPDVTKSNSGNESSSQPGPQPFARQKLAADLTRVAARSARLKAD
jgi:hypothetical protein